MHKESIITVIRNVLNEILVSKQQTNPRLARFGSHDETNRRKSLSDYRTGNSDRNNFEKHLKEFSSQNPLDSGETKPEKRVDTHIKVYGHANCSSDYFNNLKKCWEPLIEPCSAIFLFDEVNF